MTKLLGFLISDEQIIRRIRNGEEHLLAYLYEKNLRMIMKYVMQNSGTEADAAEVLQDALVVLWEKIRSGDFVLTSRISTFLYGVVKKIWLKELARRKKQAPLEQIKENPGTDPPIDDALEKSELSELVKTCMARLSPLCRKILIAFYYEDQSMQEISRLCNLANEDVAKTKKYQCKKELTLLVTKAMQV